MLKNKNLKLELYYLKMAFFKYHRGWSYIALKYLGGAKTFRLKPLAPEAAMENLSVHLLTGSRDWSLALWSLYSFFYYFGYRADLYIHSDGSLGPAAQQQLRRLIPWAKVIMSEDFERDYRRQLATNPIVGQLRFERQDFFLLKKIVDTYWVGDKPLRLILDSDLLWFSRPEELIAAIKAGAADSLMMKSNAASFVSFKDGSILSEPLQWYNSGIVLYQRQNFNWSSFCQYLNRIDQTNKKNRHFIEQAGFASALANLKSLPESGYTIKSAAAGAVRARHYTSPRRPLFFIEGLNKLKKILCAA